MKNRSKQWERKKSNNKEINEKCIKWIRKQGRKKMNIICNDDNDKLINNEAKNVTCVIIIIIIFIHFFRDENNIFISRRANK